MSALTTISIVIPVRNGRRFLAACLDSLQAEAAHTPGVSVEIITVDNASEDNSGDFIEQTYPDVRLIRNLVNQGFAGGCNRGIEASSADAVVLLNQDTVVQRGWVQALADAFADPTVGVVGCKILYPDGKTLQHAGGWIDWPLGHGSHYGQHEADHGQWDESRPVEWVTGAALAIRRELLTQIGLLDEGFWPGYFEDVDYCLRTHKQGFQVWYCADAVLTHQETSSRIERSALIRFYHRGRLRMTLKHQPPQRWLNEFVPAEERYLQGLGASDQQVLQTTYLEMVATAPGLVAHHWQADGALSQAVIDALHRLASINQPGSQTLPLPTPTPALVEFEFASSTPGIGRVISALRRQWYGVAARWAVRYLQQQQENINQQHERQLQQQRALLLMQEQRLTLLQNQLDQAALKNAALAQQLAQLQEKIKVMRDA